MVCANECFPLTWFTLNAIGISSEIGFTGAYSPMISCTAGGMLGTPAGIYTNLPFTLLGCWAVRILETLIGKAFYVGVSLMLGNAVANCPV